MQSADPSVENSRRRLYHLGRAQLAPSSLAHFVLGRLGTWALLPVRYPPCRALCRLWAARLSSLSAVAARNHTHPYRMLRCGPRESTVVCTGSRAGSGRCRVSGLGRVLVSAVESFDHTETTLFVMVFVLGSARRSCIYSGREERYNKYTAACTAIVRVGPLAPLRFLHETVTALLALLCLGVVLIKFSLAWQHHLRHKIGHHILSPIFV